MNKVIASPKKSHTYSLTPGSIEFAIDAFLSSSNPTYIVDLLNFLTPFPERTLFDYYSKHLHPNSKHAHNFLLLILLPLLPKELSADFFSNCPFDKSLQILLTSLEYDTYCRYSELAHKIHSFKAPTSMPSHSIYPHLFTLKDFLKFDPDEILFPPMPTTTHSQKSSMPIKLLIDFFKLADSKDLFCKTNSRWQLSEATQSKFQDTVLNFFRDDPDISSLLTQYMRPCTFFSPFSKDPFNLGTPGYVLSRFILLKINEIQYNFNLIIKNHELPIEPDLETPRYIRYYYKDDSHHLFGVYLKVLLQDGKLFGLACENPECLSTASDFRNFKTKHTAVAQWVDGENLLEFFKKPETYLHFTIKQLRSLSSQTLLKNATTSSAPASFWGSFIPRKQAPLRVNKPDSLEPVSDTLNQALSHLSSKPAHFEFSALNDILSNSHPSIKLFPAQQHMLRLLLSCSGELGYPILCCPPGSGKTLSALLFFADKLLSKSISKPILIVGSSISLNANWEHEINSHITPLHPSLTAKILTKPSPPFDSSFVIVCSTSLQSFFKKLNKEDQALFSSQFGGMIVDEAHEQLSSKSLATSKESKFDLISVTQLLFYLRGSIPHTLVLTATPSPDNILQFMLHFYLAYLPVYIKHSTAFPYFETLYDSIFKALFTQLSDERKISRTLDASMPLLNNRTQHTISTFIRFFRSISSFFYFGQTNTSSAVTKKYKLLNPKPIYAPLSIDEDDLMLGDMLTLSKDEITKLSSFLSANFKKSEIDLYPKLMQMLWSLPTYKDLISAKLHRSLSKNKKICIPVARLDLAQDLKEHIQHTLLGGDPLSVKIYKGDTNVKTRHSISQALKNRISYTTLARSISDHSDLKRTLKTLHSNHILIPLSKGTQDTVFTDSLDYSQFPYFRINAPSSEALLLAFSKLEADASRSMKDNFSNIKQPLLEILSLRVVIFTSAGAVGVSFDANTMLLLQFPWSSSQKEQITGRIGRADGRGHSHVSIYELPLPLMIQLLIQKYFSYKDTLNLILRQLASKDPFTENHLLHFLTSLSRACLIELLYNRLKKSPPSDTHAIYQCLDSNSVFGDTLETLTFPHSVSSKLGSTLTLVQSDDFLKTLSKTVDSVWALPSQSPDLTLCDTIDWGISGSLVIGNVTLRAIPGTYTFGSTCSSESTMPDFKLVVPMRLPSDSSPDKTPIEIIEPILDFFKEFFDADNTYVSRLEFFIGLNCQEGTVNDSDFQEALQFQLETLKASLNYPFPFSVSLFGIAWSNKDKVVPFGALRNHLICHAKTTLSDHPHQLLLSMDADTSLPLNTLYQAFTLGTQTLPSQTLNGGSFGYQLHGEYFKFVNELSFELRNTLLHDEEPICYCAEPLMFFSGNLKTLPDDLFNLYGLDGRGVHVSFNHLGLKLINPLKDLIQKWEDLPCVENVSRFLVKERSELTKLSATLEQPCNPRTFANQVAFFFGVSFASVNHLMRIVNPYSLVQNNVSLETIKHFLNVLEAQSNCFTKEFDLSHCFEGPNSPITLKVLLGSSDTERFNNFSTLSTHTKLQFAFKALILWAKTIVQFLSTHKTDLSIPDSTQLIAYNNFEFDSSTTELETDDRFETWGLRCAMSLSGHLNHVLLDSSSQFQFSPSRPKLHAPSLIEERSFSLKEMSAKNALNTLLLETEREFYHHFETVASVFEGKSEGLKQYLITQATETHETGAAKEHLKTALSKLYTQKILSATTKKRSSPDDISPDSKRVSLDPFESTYENYMLTERGKTRFLEFCFKKELTEDVAREQILSEAKKIRSTNSRINYDNAIPQALTLLLERP